jgi:FAD synthetase
MRVLITGCFDILHPGHLFLLQEGAKLGEVYVIIARDATVVKYKKKLPIISQEQRLEVIRAIKYVTYATIGEKNGKYLEKAISLQPDIILLGPNQRISQSFLKEELQKLNAGHIQVKRLEKFNDDFPLTSSSKIKEKILTQGRPPHDPQ